MATAIWWVRRDLRLADNRPLAAALEEHGRVVPVFVLDPALMSRTPTASKRVAFLLDGLRALDSDLRQLGSRLVVRRGDPVSVLASVLRDSNAGAIFAEEGYSPFARRRDARVGQRLPLRLAPGIAVHPPDTVRKADGSPYSVFTPFSRAWKRLPMPSPGGHLPAPPKLAPIAGIPSEAIPDTPVLPESVPFVAGEAEGQRRLRRFTSGAGAPIHDYKTGRDRLDADGTSRLSPYLRFGMVSARQALVAAMSAVGSAEHGERGTGVTAWLDELIWREFYSAILFHFPTVLSKSFRPDTDRIGWENDEGQFAAWCEGETGYPVVDAAMRQLVASGWMHNRARMIVASFLVKDLLVDWRWGERFFMQHLVDGEPAANNGGWQWTAGTGTDAAPFFRVFNPVLQGKRHDPDGAFVRSWVPELRRVPSSYVHAPWDMPDKAQRESGVIVGVDYPAPIVDHARARDRALAAYARARKPD